MLSVYALLPLGPLRNDSDDSNQPKAQCWFELTPSYLKCWNQLHPVQVIVFDVFSERTWIASDQVPKRELEGRGWQKFSPLHNVGDWHQKRIHLFFFWLVKKNKTAGGVCCFLAIYDRGICIAYDRIKHVSPSHCRPQPTRFLAEHAELETVAAHIPPRKNV